MFPVTGLVVVFGMVFGGFMLAGGHFEVIIEAAPLEVMMIFGAAVGASGFIGSTPPQLWPEVHPRIDWEGNSCSVSPVLTEALGNVR